MVNPEEFAMEYVSELEGGEALFVCLLSVGHSHVPVTSDCGSVVFGFS